MTGNSRCRCARAATSGTTPPKRACRSVCEATTLDRITRSSVKTAAAVSSQEVSMARKCMSVLPEDLGQRDVRPLRFVFLRPDFDSGDLGIQAHVLRLDGGF